MKKYIVILLLVVCFIFAGCADCGTVQLTQYPDGKIAEYYYIPYAETELKQAGITDEESLLIKQKAQDELNTLFLSYIDSYRARIDQSQDYTEDEKLILKDSIKFDNSFINKTEQFYEVSTTGIKEVIKYIRYTIYFNNSTSYLEFKNANQLLKEPKTILEEKNLFTTTTKVVKDPVFDNIATESITLGKYAINKIEETILNVLSGDGSTENRTIAQERWNAIKLAVNYKDCSEKFIYRYAVPTARLHSNANQVTKEFSKTAQTYMYCHSWEIQINNAEKPIEQQVNFEYWTTTANKAVWYGFIFAGALITMGIIYFVSKRKDKVIEDNNN